MQQRIRVVDPVQRVRRETGRTDGGVDFLRVGWDGGKETIGKSGDMESGCPPRYRGKMRPKEC
jgi:hypothetical protein